MGQPQILVVGGGLAGLSAGCYALQSGYRVTIVEHNLALGGVCTAWHRGLYTVDGCIHWLTGGPFERLYRELQIVPAVPLRTLDTWMTYRNVRDGIEVPFTRDLDALTQRLTELFPHDADELKRLREAASEFLALKQPFTPPELLGLRDSLRGAWEMRSTLPALVRYRKPVGQWAREHVKSPRLARLFTQVMLDSAPMFFLLMVLGYLEKGYLSRPEGGTQAFRDALELAYRKLGGEVLLNTTVDEILVQGDRASGVRLTDGSLLPADRVISTASSPETVLRLLGGRYQAQPTRERLENWKMFDPIVLTSVGVAQPYTGAPNLLVLDGIEPFDAGGRNADSMMVRVCNDDPCFGPRGHSVIQNLQPTEYAYWAQQGTRYGTAKEAFAEATIRRLAPHFDGLRESVRMIDVATPLTYWRTARSWRGAYEGWMPSGEVFFSHVKKTLSGLSGLYMAGQWVEPGGGVPMAVMSGRQVVQLLCHDDARPFVASASEAAASASV